jgi:hypothetical protein
VTAQLKVLTVPIRRNNEDMGDRYVASFEKAIVDFGVPFKPDLVLVSNGRFESF